MMLPVLTSRYGYFGDNASAAIACLLRGQSVSGSCEPDRSIHQMGCSNIPKGKCTVRFHDTDMYIATHPADFVSLPPEAAICGDTREDGFSRPNPRPGTFSGPWWDSGVEFYRTQSAKFFPQLRAAFAAEGKGHLLDGIYQDQELDPTRQSMMSAFYCYFKCFPIATNTPAYDRDHQCRGGAPRRFHAIGRLQHNTQTILSARPLDSRAA
eukprot:SAG31_NODE_2214_length_6174_cov_3.902551_1_plen_210_part_00